jgi:hypothetical protein
MMKVVDISMINNFSHVSAGEQDVVKKLLYGSCSLVHNLNILK